MKRKLSQQSDLELLLCSASAVVFANKAVFSKYGFHFTYTLTLIHTLVTLVGMWVMSSAMGLFTVKPLPLVKIAPLAAAFVGEHKCARLACSPQYACMSEAVRAFDHQRTNWLCQVAAYIVFCNLNLQLNTVGFYQVGLCSVHRLHCALPCRL